MALNVNLLESSFAIVAPKAEELTNQFYSRLFEKYPQIRHMFPDELGEQKKKLGATLAMIVASFRKPEALTAAIGELGVRHLDYGVKREHYAIVGENLVATLADVAGDQWTGEMHNAWVEAYQMMVDIIDKALDNHEKRHAA